MLSGTQEAWLHTSAVWRDWQHQYREAWLYQADPRTRHWLLIQDSPVPVWIITLCYITIVMLGPCLIENRKPIQMQRFLVVYNMGQTALSLYMAAEILLSVIDAEYNILCTPYSKKSWSNPKEMRVAKILWLYFFSKAIDLVDTVCMILRKKHDQITFLHVFHHISILNIWWWAVMFIPGGLSWFGAWINSMVHTVMYLYYGLSAIPSLRGKLWWKRYITRIQLTQFVMTLGHTVYSLVTDCPFPSWGKKLLTCYMIVMLILFSNFYIRAYACDNKKKSAPNNIGHFKYD